MSGKILTWSLCSLVFSCLVAFALVYGAGIQYSTWVGSTAVQFDKHASVFVYSVLGLFLWPVVGLVLTPTRFRSMA